MNRKIVLDNLKDFIFITLGIFAAGFGLKGFIIPNGFIDGGVTGISLLISHLTFLPISLLIFALNLPFIFLGRKHISKIFSIKALIAIIGLSISLIFIEYPVITSDKLLVSIFGGFMLGAGIGLSVRGGGVLDGTEVLALYLGRKFSFTIGEVIFVINLIIFSFAAFLLSLEIAMYSLLIYLTASKTVDFFIQGIEEYIGVTVLSQKNKEIREKIISEFKRGVTVYKGAGGYGSESPKDILFTVVTRLDLVRMKREIIAIDPNAVIFEHSISNAQGGVLKKRPLH